MLSVAGNYIRRLNSQTRPLLYGQDWNDEAWAVCKSDMLIKGSDADNIRRDDTFSKGGFDRNEKGEKYTFDYMLANPPFGVEWKQQQKYIAHKAESLGYNTGFRPASGRSPTARSVGGRARSSSLMRAGGLAREIFEAVRA